MSCKHCDKSKCITDIGRGCCFCADGDEMEITLCEGGSKLNVCDWLKDMPRNRPDEIIEVSFKNTRKGYYVNDSGTELKVGDVVAVESSPGHDIGIVSLTGDLVYAQMRKTGFNASNAEFRKIYRKAKPYDIEKWQEAIALEHSTMIEARQIAADLDLNMKIGDVEYQGDRMKAIFYYIAEERVDFRELIKVFAGRFKVRVEMRQIGARQEAGRIGGIGSCGRELCCASWISGFASVTTNAARTQEISLNPQKLAGQCGKLKCCLMYELDSYLDARRELPRVNAPLETIDGAYNLVKTDILGRTMYFGNVQGGAGVLTALHVERVREIMAMNRKGKKPDTLVDATKVKPDPEADPGYVSAAGEDSITRFDSAHREGRRGRGRGGRNRGQGGNNGNNGDRQQAGSQQQGQQGQQGQRRQSPQQEQSQPRQEPRKDGGQAPREGDGNDRNRNRNHNRNRNRRPKPNNEG